MQLTNDTYDRLKWFVLIFLPALAVLCQGIGELYQITDMPNAVSLINLFTIFLGTILQISTHHYHQGGNHAT